MIALIIAHSGKILGLGEDGQNFPGVAERLDHSYLAFDSITGHLGKENSCKAFKTDRDLMIEGLPPGLQDCRCVLACQTHLEIFGCPVLSNHILLVTYHLPTL